MEESMSVDIKDVENVVVLTVKGNLMGGPETITLHETVKSCIEKGKNRIVIDLSKVNWMNSSGLGTLMGCLTSLKNAKGDLKLSGITDKVENLFVITKLITLFETYATAEDAVQAFLGA
jgi:anti-sigma B factor antagonist